MAITKATSERIADIDKKIEQMKAQKRALQNRAKAQERKERNHRLIQIGVMVESYADCTIDNLDSFKVFLEQYGRAIAETQNKNITTPNIENIDRGFLSSNN